MGDRPVAIRPQTICKAVRAIINRDADEARAKHQGQHMNAAKHIAGGQNRNAGGDQQGNQAKHNCADAAKRQPHQKYRAKPRADPDAVDFCFGGFARKIGMQRNAGGQCIDAGGVFGKVQCGLDRMCGWGRARLGVVAAVVAAIVPNVIKGFGFAYNTTFIRIGEQIQFKIAVNETENVVFPNLKLDSLGKVELVEALPTDTLKNRLEKKYLLTSFDSGVYLIPQQLVLVRNNKFLTDSLLVNVATIQVDTTKQKMFPIKAIQREPKTFDDYKHLFWWLIPIFILIAVILYFVFRKKKEKEVPKVYIAPIQEALQRLKELDEKHLLEQNKIKIYYSELTDIVRTYIEKDINIPALESTTNELIETIQDFNASSKLGISKETIQQLKEVLQSADLVKFAKFAPIVEEIKGHRNLAERILQSLKPVKEPIKEAENEVE